MQSRECDFKTVKKPEGSYDFSGFYIPYMLKTTHDHERSNFMKIRLCAALLLAAFCVTLFTGCASAEALRPMPQTAETTLATEPVPRAAVPEPVPATTPTVAAERSEKDRLTKEEARDIALKHAGLTAAEVTRLRVEFDYDDGVPEYEVDFFHNGYEYDYEIHAETGKIIKWDKERND